MTLLGIETSCDETAAAVWRGDELASNVIASQEEHILFGGVVPELASRAHVRLIVPVVQRAIEDAGIALGDVEGIAVTYGPGLAGSLLVGLNFAKAVALAQNTPFIGVHHIEGHVFSNSVVHAGPQPPFLALIISGGHTQFILVREWGSYEVVGRTHDDAAGEAFDKVARMLDLPYPGGPAIEKLAREGDSSYVSLPRGKIKGKRLDFSYSGLKTAVLYHLQSLDAAERIARRADVAASFQEAAVQVLVDRSLLALETYDLRQLALAGGVACNTLLRQKLQEASAARGFELFYPPVELCTDNAAMIVRAGKFHLEQDRTSDFSLSPRPSLALETRAGEQKAVVH